MSTVIQGFKVSEAAYKVGLPVADGKCPGNGFASGYTRERVGLFELSSRNGMAANQSLVWEVIRGTGNSVMASNTRR